MGAYLMAIKSADQISIVDITDAYSVIYLETSWMQSH